ncbi:MAG: Cna B-type domain-containing protein [Eubacteriaceae bacterium]|nr:Cna B-type domain-containing protein [Eubacteriaceae bacterium]
MKIKKALCFLFALIMLLSFMPTVQKVYAEEIPEVIPEEIPEETTKFDVSGSKTADPTELEGDDRETTVTLSLPSAEYQNEIDIVFTMDSSTSTLSGTAFADSVNSLFASILNNNPNVKLKVGVVRFRGRAYDALDYLSNGSNKGLVVYSDDTKDLINQALNMTKAQVEAAFGNGSNTHAGLVVADEMLEADSEVPSENKYVILLTDGKSYIWYNDANEPTTIYSQYMKRPGNNTNGSVGIAYNGMPSLNQSAGYDKYGYAMDVLDPTNKSNIFVFSSFEDLYNSNDPELTGVTKWDQPCFYAGDKTDVPKGTVTKQATTNGAELFPYTDWRADYKSYFEYTPEGKWTDIPYLQANPYSVIKNNDGTYTFDQTTINPDYYQYHVDCMQKGVYIAAHYWADMLDKYNCAAITYLDSTDSVITNVAIPFSSWLRTVSKYGAQAKDSSAVQQLFTDIDNSIRYMVQEGVVTDQITDDFTLKNEDNKDAFRMTRSGEALTVTYADGKWNFGTNVDGVYPYVVEYDADTKTITWTINVPIENANPVTLSYDLILREDAGSAFYDTNVSAVLDYVTSDEKEGSFTFEIPEVSYIRYIDIRVEKIWEDNNNKYKTRPESISVNLLVGEKVVDTAEIKDDGQGNWVYTFEDLPDSELVEKDGEKTIKQIEYEVEEPETVAGYKAPEIQVAEGVVEAGVYIINTQEDLVTITYKLNGGSYNGDTSDIIEKYPKGVVINIHEAPVRNGYTFLYWKGSEFDPGDEYTVTEDHEFVAQWKEGSPQTGEENSILLWVLIMAIAYIELFSVMLIEKKRRMDRSHE